MVQRSCWPDRRRHRRGGFTGFSRTAYPIWDFQLRKQGRHLSRYPARPLSDSLVATFIIVVDDPTVWLLECSRCLAQAKTNSGHIRIYLLETSESARLPLSPCRVSPATKCGIEIIDANQYEQFWNDPSHTPIMWIGLLLSVLCCAIKFQQVTPQDSGMSLMHKQLLTVSDLSGRTLRKRYNASSLATIQAAHHSPTRHFFSMDR